MTVAPVVKRFTTPESLAAELPDWDSSPLGASALTPMQTKIWIQACAETLSRGGNISVVVVEDSQGIAAIAPLVSRSVTPTVSELLGVRELGEPSDFIYRDDAALAFLIAAISRDCTLLDFQRMPALSPTVAAIQSRFRGSAVVWIRHANNCPSITIPPDMTDPEQLLSSHLRSDLRRAQRKAELHGKVTYEIHAPRSAKEFFPLYEQALRVEAAGWKGASGSAVAMNEVQKVFFRRYGVLASEASVLRLAFIRINDVAAAMQYAVEWNGAFWLLKVGYDETYARGSPGQLLLLHTLRYSVQRGLRSYEFLGGEEVWTRRWTTAALTTVNIKVYPRSFAGMVTMGRDLMESHWKKAAARLARQRALPPAPAETVPTTRKASAIDG